MIDLFDLFDLFEGEAVDWVDPCEKLKSKLRVGRTYRGQKWMRGK